MRKQAVLAANLAVVATLLVVAGVGAKEPAAVGRPTSPPPGKASGQAYRVRWLPGAKIALDGRAQERVWGKAAADKRFVFPWKQAKAPKTEFRALWKAPSEAWLVLVN